MAAEALLTALDSKSIPHFTPSSTEFTSLAANFVLSGARPSVVVRPRDAAQVAAAVAACVAHGQPFSVRSGGHDIGGRSVVEGVVNLDMRDVNHVVVAADRASARVGGGILAGHLANELEREGLLTPTGQVASVGYVGWSTLGGYGPFAPRYGLGVDQILAARVVDARGEIVEADEELLKAIRGGGGAFGVVVELTIQVYPLHEVSWLPLLSCRMQDDHGSRAN